MTSEQVTLVAALIAAVFSIASIFVNALIAFRSERRQVVWRKEVERFFELEELAGQLAEDLGSYRPASWNTEELASMNRRLELAAGRFARYPEVRQAIRDLHNVLGRMSAAKRERDSEEREVRLELDPAYRKLLEACDKILGTRKL
jgi:hypothetical protein